MKPSVWVVVFRLGGALLMVMLWHFSQSPWSHHSSTLGTRDYTDHSITWTQSSSNEAVGASYYVGGSSALLLAAGWLFYTLFKTEPDAWLPGLITLGTAAMGGIALGRWFAYFNAKPEMEVSRYYAGGYVMQDEAIYCFVITIALALLGIVSLVMSRKSATPAPKADSVTG